jgi:hypothetical protein
MALLPPRSPGQLQMKIFQNGKKIIALGRSQK